MHQTYSWLRRRARRLVGSIAFWPTLLALGFLAVAVAMRAVGSRALFAAVDEALPFLLVRDRTVALNLLTTLIGGLISLMVFSFSMVMVLLANAASQLSPRLLPTLIGSRRHQVVLGCYLGTILYCIVIAMGFGLGVEADVPPSASLALAILFGIGCLGLFVYFIHGVSRSIQVGVVLRRAHLETRDSLGGLLRRQRATRGPDAAPDARDWPVVEARDPGFFRGVDEAGLAAFAKTHDTCLVLLPSPGDYLVPGDPLLRTRVALPDGALESDRFRRLIWYSPEGDAGEYFGYGLEQMMEVALKALSPGINDPGTAVIAVDYVREILVASIAVAPAIVSADEDGVPRVWQTLRTWGALAERVLTPLLHYGADDPMTLRALDALRATLRDRLAAAGHDADLQRVERLLARVPSSRQAAGLAV